MLIRLQGAGHLLSFAPEIVLLFTCFKGSFVSHSPEHNLKRQASVSHTVFYGIPHPVDINRKSSTGDHWINQSWQVWAPQSFCITQCVDWLCKRRKKHTCVSQTNMECNPSVEHKINAPKTDTVCHAAQNPIFKYTSVKSFVCLVKFYVAKWLESVLQSILSMCLYTIQCFCYCSGNVPVTDQISLLPVFSCDARISTWKG